MESSLANLREWIDQSPHLKNIRQDDQVFFKANKMGKILSRFADVEIFEILPHLPSLFFIFNWRCDEIFRSWSNFCVGASSVLRGRRRSWITSTWSRGPCLSGLTGQKNDLCFQNVASSGKRWDPSEPGVAELLKQGVYLPLPGYDDQVGTEKIIFPFQRSASKYFESWVWFLLGMLNFPFQGRFVVLCSFGKINPSKVSKDVNVNIWGYKARSG